MESRIRREVYVRFGGECSENCHRNMVRRRALTLLKILIACILGMLLLVSLYALYKNNIIPNVTSKTNDMFNYTA